MVRVCTFSLYVYDKNRKNSHNLHVKTALKLCNRNFDYLFYFMLLNPRTIQAPDNSARRITFQKGFTNKYYE